jgi:Bacterial RNA polymerase, alpha chain C terminal domain
VTDRGRTAGQPDGTPVEVLPLQPFTVNALRTAGVLTLGELRAMGDHELLRLRRFGRGALADVRALVPAAAAPSGQVTIAGRTFTLGAVYAPRRVRGHRKPRRLLQYSADSPLPGGRVDVANVPSGSRLIMAGEEWAAWAGEPVEDVGR